MRLYLLRHALALSRDEWDGTDALRPLSADGTATAHAVASRIASLDLGLAAVVTSPYERALRTAVIVHEALGGEVPLVEDRRLEPKRFTSESFAKLIHDHAGDTALMLVGHDPSMSTVLAGLVGGGRYVLRKGGLVRVDLDPADVTGGALKWFVPPRLL